MLMTSWVGAGWAGSPAGRRASYEVVAPTTGSYDVPGASCEVVARATRSYDVPVRAAAPEVIRMVAPDPRP